MLFKYQVHFYRYMLDTKDTHIEDQNKCFRMFFFFRCFAKLSSARIGIIVTSVLGQVRQVNWIELASGTDSSQVSPLLFHEKFVCRLWENRVRSGFRVCFHGFSDPRIKDGWERRREGGKEMPGRIPRGL